MLLAVVFALAAALANAVNLLTQHKASIGRRGVRRHGRRGHHADPDSATRSHTVLITLILAAGVADLNVAVANVALPTDHGNIPRFFGGTE